jgi:predicted anti-sigma-YlaC factor YlaD
MQARILVSIFLAASLCGCATIQHAAINKVADALSGGGSAYGSDDDPELIRDAAPFSLKLMETLLAQTPNHTGLLSAAAGGFTQYAWAFVQQDADRLEDTDVDAAFAARARARGLYLRARDYGMRALESRHKGFGTASVHEPRMAAAMLDVQDAAAMYWTAVAWAAAIAVDKDDADAISALRNVDALVARLAELVPDYDHGALDSFLVSYEMARPGARTPEQAAAAHFERALQLSNHHKAGPLVAYAESICVHTQDRAGFVRSLQQALAVDADAVPGWRLENRVMQRRARWLLGRVDQLFIEGPDGPGATP